MEDKSIPLKRDIMRSYYNDKITVFWRPELCTHSTICIGHLPKVFNMRSTPWIDMQGESDERIIEIVDRCPSGALTYKLNE